jgi:hypothetical protein
MSTREPDPTKATAVGQARGKSHHWTETTLIESVMLFRRPQGAEHSAVSNGTSGNETAMTIEHDAAEGDTKIRTPRPYWLIYFPVGGLWFVNAGLALAPPAVFDMSDDRTVGGLFALAAACISVATALWLRTFGVDLMPESADVRGPRRRSVPWKDVQAVVQHRQFGAWVVRLNLESGKPVTLRAPTTAWGLGGAQYEREYHRIGQWWLAHRGESWRPAR